MRFKTRTFFGSILCVLAIYVIFFTCIDTIAFNRHFFNYEYGLNQTAEKLGMSKTGLYDASDTLLDYMQGYRGNINVKVKVHDQYREVFNEREKAHMVDVKNLYQNARLIRDVAFAVVVLLFVFLYYENKKEVKEVLSHAYIRVALLFAFLLSAVVIYAISDFTAFWTLFHKIFFTNDLWLLDPNTSLMINMFPEAFFNHLVFAIAGSFIAIYIVLFMMSVRYQRKLRKQAALKEAQKAV